MIVGIKYHKSTYGWIYIKDTEGSVVAKYKQMSKEWIAEKLKTQVSKRLRKDIQDHGYEKIGLRYYPDLDKMIMEYITW
ncbi:MAG: hypothetical protein P8X89_15160 [Reinekea sp.]